MSEFGVPNTLYTTVPAQNYNYPPCDAPVFIVFKSQIVGLLGGSAG